MKARSIKMVAGAAEGGYPRSHGMTIDRISKSHEFGASPQLLISIELSVAGENTARAESIR